MWKAALGVVALALLLFAGYAVVSVGKTGSVPWPWGHPAVKVLPGTWHGTYLNGREDLVLKADHTFVQRLDGFTGLGISEITGSWEYSDGALRLVPGLWVTSHVTGASHGDQYVVSPELELRVGSTILSWSPRIWDENTLLYKGG